MLSQYLFRSGSDYLDYAAVFAEQMFVHEELVKHYCYCDICGYSMGADMTGQRFTCLDCLDTDLCADCYATWEKSNGQMEYCKGHTFYELPRQCWYQFKEGIVMEDGSTLPQVIDFLEKRFTMLLEGAESETAI